MGVRGGAPREDEKMNQEYVVAHEDMTECFWSSKHGWKDIEHATRFVSRCNAQHEIDTLVLNGVTALFSEEDEGDLNDD